MIEPEHVIEAPGDDGHTDLVFDAAPNLAMLHATRRTAEGGHEVLVVSAGVCANAGCPCRDVLLGGRTVLSTQPRCDDDPLPVPGFDEGAPFDKPMFQARLGLADGVLVVDREPELDGAARSAAGWLRSGLSRPLVANIRSWAESEYADRDRVKEIWRDGDWSEWRPGERVAWDMAYSGPWNDSYEIGGNWFTVEEWYCVRPSCNCETVEITVVRDNEAVPWPERVGGFDVPATDPTAVGRVKAERGQRARTLEVWELARSRYDYVARFRERIEAMKPVGAWLHEHIARATGGRAAAKAATRIGRNDPCTCGSGKKYKRCCGA